MTRRPSLLGFLCVLTLVGGAMVWAQVRDEDADEGPLAALQFAESYRGPERKGRLHCYPEAVGIPFSDTPRITGMSEQLWRPADLAADFRRRMAALAPEQRKRAILVVLKTERCATKRSRLCSVTTAALEKGSTPLVREFEIHGLQLLPRDNDNPPGSLAIEPEAWKNSAAGEYGFLQGPGATLVILDPRDGSKVATSNAAQLKLLQREFVINGGRTPELERFLGEALRRLADDGRAPDENFPSIN